VFILMMKVLSLALHTLSLRVTYYQRRSNEIRS